MIPFDSYWSSLQDALHRLADPSAWRVPAFDDDVVTDAMHGLREHFALDWELRVTCSDRDRHRGATLGVIARARGSREYEFSSAVQKSQSSERFNLDVKHASPLQHKENGQPFVVWKCPRCPLNKRWTWENSQKFSALLESSGVARLDVSILPR